MNLADFILEKKYLILGAAAVILGLELLVLQPWRLQSAPEVGQMGITQPAAETARALLALETGRETLRAGETFEAVLVLSTFEKRAEAFDAVLIFDPARLAVNAVTPAETFSEYPRQTFDNNQGRVFLSGTTSLGGENEAVSEGTLGSISFTALSAGPAEISFLFTPGQTTDSNVVAEGTTEDILTGVTNLQLWIE